MDSGSLHSRQSRVLNTRRADRWRPHQVNHVEQSVRVYEPRLMGWCWPSDNWYSLLRQQYAQERCGKDAHWRLRSGCYWGATQHCCHIGWCVDLQRSWHSLGKDWSRTPRFWIRNQSPIQLVQIAIKRNQKTSTGSKARLQKKQKWRMRRLLLGCFSYGSSFVGSTFLKS